MSLLEGAHDLTTNAMGYGHTHTHTLLTLSFIITLTHSQTNYILNQTTKTSLVVVNLSIYHVSTFESAYRQRNLFRNQWTRLVVLAATASSLIWTTPASLLKQITSF